MKSFEDQIFFIKNNTTIVSALVVIMLMFLLLCVFIHVHLCWISIIGLYCGSLCICTSMEEYILYLVFRVCW